MATMKPNMAVGSHRGGGVQSRVSFEWVDGQMELLRGRKVPTNSSRFRRWAATSDHKPSCHRPPLTCAAVDHLLDRQ